MSSNTNDKAPRGAAPWTAADLMAEINGCIGVTYSEGLCSLEDVEQVRWENDIVGATEAFVTINGQRFRISVEAC